MWFGSDFMHLMCFLVVQTIKTIILTPIQKWNNIRFKAFTHQMRFGFFLRAKYFLKVLIEQLGDYCAATKQHIFWIEAAFFFKLSDCKQTQEGTPHLQQQ